jgi:uncharacterized protein with HEPN domain
MPLEERDAAYLWEILQACDAIQRFVLGKSIDQYMKDDLLQAAVERKIEIIGEASRKISDSFKKDNPDIPWKSIIAQRNVMVHDYGQIKQDRLWGLTHKHIPELKSRLQPLLPPLPSQLDL